MNGEIGRIRWDLDAQNVDFVLTGSGWSATHPLAAPLVRLLDLAFPPDLASQPDLLQRAADLIGGQLAQATSGG